MHDYSIDNHPKEKILFVLAFLAIALAPILNSIVQNVLKTIGASAGWSSAPITAIPVFGLFGLLYWIFNKYLWRISMFRKFLLVPDLNGKWTVEGSTTLKNGKEVEYAWGGVFTVTQSWSKILIYLQASQSASKSVSASIHLEDSVGHRLLYQYENEPSADQLELKKHSGSAELLFDIEGLTAKGHYYTDQHRNTVGTMKLRKSENDN
ncbi:MAG: hypothetical protein Q7U64_02105 [Desulfocapsaceae bacterium]|nr:hypothetical protein [Desulfocapsaceae bacterium]